MGFGFVCVSALMANSMAGLVLTRIHIPRAGGGWWWSHTKCYSSKHSFPVVQSIVGLVSLSQGILSNKSSFPMLATRAHTFN